LLTLVFTDRYQTIGKPAEYALQPQITGSRVRVITKMEGMHNLQAWHKKLTEAGVDETVRRVGMNYFDPTLPKNPSQLEGGEVVNFGSTLRLNTDDVYACPFYLLADLTLPFHVADGNLEFPPIESLGQALDHGLGPADPQ
jgi:hypothetical protein